MYKQLFILVEGNDDERFIDKVIKPRLKKKFEYINIIKYSQKKSEKINNFIKSISSMKDAEYVFISDIDKKTNEEEKKKYLLEIYSSLKPDKICIVVKEIESWYCAGLNELISKKLGIVCFEHTNELTKELFNISIHKKYQSRIDLMIEILKNYCFDTAKQKNTSLMSFIKCLNIG